MGLVEVARAFADPSGHAGTERDESCDHTRLHELLTDETEGGAKKPSEEHDSERRARPLGAPIEDGAQIRQGFVRCLGPRAFVRRGFEALDELVLERRRPARRPAARELGRRARESLIALHPRKLGDQRADRRAERRRQSAEVEGREERAADDDERGDRYEDVRADQNGSE